MMTMHICSGVSFITRDRQRTHVSRYTTTDSSGPNVPCMLIVQEHMFPGTLLL